MRTALSSLFAVLAAASLAPAQESFEPKVEKGDKWTVRSESSLTLNMKVTSIEGGAPGETRERQLKTKRTEVKDLEFTDVEKGLPVGWKATYAESKVRTGAANATDAELEVATAEVEGKTYFVSGSEVTPEDTPADIKAGLREPEAFYLLLPKDKKSLNDSWEISAAKVSKLVVRGAWEDPSDDSKVRVTLSEIVNQDGSSIAVLALTGSIKADSKQGFQVEFEFSGSLRYDLTNQRPLSLEVSGEAKSLVGKIVDAHGQEVGHVDAQGSAFRLEVFYSPK